MKDPVKVLSLVSYNFLPAKMGGQKGIAFFNQYLGKELELGCATVESNQPSGHESYKIYPLLSNGKSRYINLLYFFKLKKFINEHKFTHLILEHPYFGWLGILLKWSCRINLVVHSHNIEANRFKSVGKWWWGILWNYERFTHRKADHNFFIQDNDRMYAIEKFGLAPALCSTITYGFEMSAAPSVQDKAAARDRLCKLHNIPAEASILLFNGTLDYKPNLEALDNILYQINPILQADKKHNYYILICGNRLPASYNKLEAFREQNILYAGFVDDIGLYFKGAGIFLNPVVEGGGIKTKVVEALGNDLTVVSTRSGGIGIPEEITGKKLQLVEDADWKGFATAVISADVPARIPANYFDHFYWGNIAKKAAAILGKETTKI